MLPYRSASGIPCVRFAPRPLRSAKGTGLSEPQIGVIARMGYDARALFSHCTLTLTLSRRGRGDVALPLRPGHPLRSLRSAKGTGLSEPQITLIFADGL